MRSFVLSLFYAFSEYFHDKTNKEKLPTIVIFKLIVFTAAIEIKQERYSLCYQFDGSGLFCFQLLYQQIHHCWLLCCIFTILTITRIRLLMFCFNMPCIIVFICHYTVYCITVLSDTRILAMGLVFIQEDLPPFWKTK